MQEFLSMYGPFLLLALFLVYLVGINIYRSNRYKKEASALIENLKKGDYVKTYAGFYGTVVELSEKTLENGTLEKLAKLELSENNIITVDANSIYVVLNELKQAPTKKRASKVKQEKKDEVKETVETKSE